MSPCMVKVKRWGRSRRYVGGYCLTDDHHCITWQQIQLVNRRMDRGLMDVPRDLDVGIDERERKVDRMHFAPDSRC